jgi:hypothetical protein
MASFCKQCSIELFGKDYGDFADLCKPGECTVVLCEECGIIEVDETGENVTDYSLG